eukprot:SAG22_NODE_480_length_9955_cov_3.601258_4_plen_358_part_00
MLLPFATRRRVFASLSAIRQSVCCAVLPVRLRLRPGGAFIDQVLETYPLPLISHVTFDEGVGEFTIYMHSDASRAGGRALTFDCQRLELLQAELLAALAAHGNDNVTNLKAASGHPGVGDAGGGSDDSDDGGGLDGPEFLVPTEAKINQAFESAKSFAPRTVSVGGMMDFAGRTASKMKELLNDDGDGDDHGDGDEVVAGGSGGGDKKQVDSDAFSDFSGSEAGDRSGRDDNEFETGSFSSGGSGHGVGLGDRTLSGVHQIDADEEDFHSDNGGDSGQSDADFSDFSGSGDGDSPEGTGAAALDDDFASGSSAGGAADADADFDFHSGSSDGDFNSGGSGDVSGDFSGGGEDWDSDD